MCVIIVVCVRRREEEEEEEKEPGIQNQKQEPHTKLWGISPVSSVKCLGKKNHMTWDLCNCLGSTNMQNMSCQLTHTLYTSHPT